MKRLFSVFLCLTVWLSVSAYSFEVDGIYYNIIGNGQVEVTYQSVHDYFYYYSPYSGNFIIPSAVTYRYMTYNVTSIGDYAFCDCRGLTSVTIPNSVTSIGDAAFYHCDGLTSVTMPNSVTSIGDYAFLCSSGLTSVTIPNSVTSIGDYAFSYCIGLTSVTIPNSVTSIGDAAFANCSSLTSVIIPRSAMPIYNYFAEYDDYGKMASCHITNVIINQGVDSIPNSAFSECISLTSVTIPNSVTSIGNYVFYKCTGLTSVTIPNSVLLLVIMFFYDCTGLTSVTIPNSVTSIGDYAFYYCSGLTSVTIPNSVTSIGDYAFYHCIGLTSVTIPNSVTSIGDYAFGRCSGLTSVTIPKCVLPFSLEKYFWVFEGCRITDVKIAEGVDEICDNAFSSDCKNLTSLTIPSSVTSIGNDAFASCNNIREITCYAKTPPDVTSTTFANYDATLYVPASSVDVYSSTIYWRNFYIQAGSDEPAALEYSLADRNVIYLNGKVYNIDGLEIKLYDAAGRLISSGDSDIEMSSCPSGIYVVTDGKGGTLKISHRR